MLQSKTRVFHRSTRAQLPVAVRGDGVYIVDSQCNRYLDACGGAAVSCLGHSHPKVIASIKQQLDRIAFAHTGFFTSEPSEQLADLSGPAHAKSLRLFKRNFAPERKCQ